MMRRKEMLSVLALVAPFVVGGFASAMNESSANAYEEAPDLCIGAGVDKEGDGGEPCEYAAWDAPVFNDEVCWDGTTVTAKGDAPCDTTAAEFYLAHGEVVDANTGAILAYAALPNTCLYVECEPNFQNDPYEDGVACCEPNGACVSPDANGNCPVGDVTWCKQVEEKANGEVVCHE